MNNQDESPVKDKKDRKNYKALERVTIEEGLKEKLNLLTAAANEALQGIAEVSKSDVINLILKLHEEGLSKIEIDDLRKTHFDVFKCLSWMQNQAKDAREKGSAFSLKELFEKSSEFMVETTDGLAKKLRKPRKRKVSENDLLPLESKNNTSE